MGENLSGDVDEVGVELGVLPGAEDLGDLGNAEAADVAQQVIGLGDELHVGVLDAVVDHLDEVTGAVGPHVGAAGGAIDVGRDGLQHRPQALVGVRGATGHDRGTVECPLLTAGDAHTHEVKATLAQGLLAAPGVGVKRVSGVDDDVAGLHEGGELLDDRLGGGSGLDHDDGYTRGAQRGHEVLQVGRGHELALGAVALHEPFGASERAVEDRDRVTVASQVSGEVRPHHPQPEDTEVGCGRCGSEAAHEGPFLCNRPETALRLQTVVADCRLRSVMPGRCAGDPATEAGGHQPASVNAV